MDRLIPRTMSSQHPDNASNPPWVTSDVFTGDDEIDEVYNSWARLGCHEAMWDAEGKDVDLNVIRKLLTKYGDFFREKIIGRDFFLTYRVPNPYVEVGDRKVFFETLQSIPKHYDVCKAVYGDAAVPPVFEVIIPFTTSVRQLIQTVNTYSKAVVQLEEVVIDYPDVKLRDIIGPVKPEKIEVIPLFEDLESMSKIDEILVRFIELTSPRYLRAFIARSDPALNNGLIAATLMAKLALHKLSAVSDSTGIEVYPIIGVGSLPFRGGLNPVDVDKFLEEYGEVYTATVQSAFRYDYPADQAVEAVGKLNRKLPFKKPRVFTHEELKLLESIIRKTSESYRAFAEAAAPTVSIISRIVPQRRMRKLHVGAFSYSRRIGNVELPRAIPYACVYYSLGIPPEFIGLRALNNLTDEEHNLLKESYIHLREDLREVGSMVCFENINMLLSGDVEAPELTALKNVLPFYVEDLQTAEAILGVKVGPRKLSERKYLNLLNNFLISYVEGNLLTAREELLEAAKMRRCLG